MRKSIVILGRLVLLLRPLIHIMLLTIILGSLGFFAAIFITTAGGYAVGNLIIGNGAINYTAIMIALGVAAVLRGLLRYAEQTCGHFIAFKLLAVIRDKVFGALRRLAPAKLENKDRGNLISIITADIELLEVFYAHTVAPVVIAVIVSTVMVVLMWQIHMFLGLVAAIGYITVGVILPAIASNRNKRLAPAHRKEIGGMNSYILESMRGIKEIKQYNTDGDRLLKIVQISDRATGLQKKLRRVDGLSFAISEAFVMTFGLASLLVGILLYKGGDISFAQVIISVTAMLSSFGPVLALANLSGSLSETVASGGRVLELLDEEPQVEEQTAGTDVVYNGAELAQVGFAYEAETVLEDVSLVIPANGIVGIKGKSGSGKSTILKLLMRFWDPISGVVSISGQDLRLINTASLRSNEGYFTQETVLFNESIIENIRIADKDATLEQVRAAAQRAAIDEFIMKLPNQYDTNIGELGGKLSSGERQRIGLARVFLGGGKLLLVDEPTSNLDSLNEKIILKSIAESAQERAVVIVSHRDSTLAIADVVYEFDGRTLKRLDIAV